MGSRAAPNSVTQGDGGQRVEPVSRKERWKHAIKEYGSAMVAFHVVLSLSSFGLCYGLVSSGIDMVAIAEQLGFNMDSQWVNSKLAGGSGTVVLAYAVHKLFTPLRMGITLTTAPILVRWLRRNGIFGFRYWNGIKLHKWLCQALLNILDKLAVLHLITGDPRTQLLNSHIVCNRLAHEHNCSCPVPENDRYDIISLGNLVLSLPNPAGKQFSLRYNSLKGHGKSSVLSWALLLGTSCIKVSFV